MIRFFGILFVVAILSLRVASAEQDGPAEITPARIFSVVDGSYSPNILRRINADGSLRASVTAEANGGKPQVSPLNADAVIDGSWLTTVGWNLRPDEREKFVATITIDLGEVLPINKVDIYWDRAAVPAKWTVSVSRDGESFQQVAGATVDDMTGKNSYEAIFPEADAQQIRIEAFGTSSPDQDSVALGQVRAYLAPGAPPPSIHHGYSLAYLDGVRRAARPSPAAWKSFTNITTGHPGIGNVVDPAGTQDVSYEVDLLTPTKLAGVKLTFDTPTAAWQHGGRIELATHEKGPWKTAVEAGFMGTGYYAIDSQEEPARYVRFTYPAHPGKQGASARLVLVEIFAPVDEKSAVQPVARVPCREGQRVSVAVFNSEGKMVRTLLMSKPGSGQAVPLYWDGHDDLGRPVPPGRYEWRALINEPHVQNIGAVGDSGAPPFGPHEAMGGVHFADYDAVGNLYYGVWFLERDGQAVRKTSPDGRPIWEAPLNGAIALAADENEVYVSRSPITAEGEDRIYRFDAPTGKPLPFPDGHPYLTVNTGRPEKVETLTRTMHARMELEPLGGLALDATRLYAGNYIKDRVEIFERSNGKKLGQIAVAGPMGTALRAADGRWDLWVASEGVVKHFTSTDGLKFREHASLKGGRAPQAVSLNPQGDELAVADNEDGIVRIYRVAPDGSTTLLRQVGTRARPGILGPDTFRPGTRWDIALNRKSDLAVGDAGNRMLRIFNSNGELVRSEYSEFQPAPAAFDIKPAGHRLLSGPWEYEVNLSGEPKSGPLWYHNGTWSVAANWMPDDSLYFSGISRRVRLPNGEDYLVFLNHDSQGLAFYHLKEGRMRRSMIVGTLWRGLDESIRAGARGALWTWRDANGNGRIDWNNPNPEEVGPQEEGEIIVPLKNASGWVLHSPGSAIDADGSIWIANYRDSIAKFQLQGFDEHANPLYDFAHPQLIVPATSKDDGFRPNNVRICSTGDIYALGFSHAAPSNDPYLWMGGREIRRYSPQGILLSVFTIPNNETVVSFALDPITPAILYTANNLGSTWGIRVWSNDGLCLASLTPDPERFGKPGWIDGFMGMDVFTPDGKQRLIYGMDVYHGKSMLFRLEAMDELQTLSGDVLVDKSP